MKQITNKACKGKNKVKNFMVTLELIKRNNYFHGIMFCDFNESYEVMPSIEFMIKLTALQQVIKILSVTDAAGIWPQGCATGLPLLPA